MSIVLSIDESPLDQAGTQDTSSSLPTKLDSDLTAIFGGAYTVLEAAVTNNAVTFGANTQTVLFTNSNGVELNGVDSGLVAIDGRQISLYTYGPDNNLVIGREDNANGTPNASGTPVFAIYLETNGSAGDENFDLNATSANLWVVEFSSLQHYLNTSSGNSAFNNFNDIVTLANKLFVTSSNPVNFDATDAPSGSSLFVAYGDGTPTPSEVGVIVTAKGAVTQGNISGGEVVKASQAGASLGGATFGIGSQHFDKPGGSAGADGDLAYFTFVKGLQTNLTVPNLDQNESDVESNIQFTQLFGATKVSFVVCQLQGGDPATVKIQALVAGVQSAGATSAIADDVPWTGNQYIDHQDQNTQVDIDKVTVVHGGLTTVFTEGATPNITNVSGGAAGILTVDFSADGGLGAIIAGLNEGDKVIYETAVEHDRLLISNPGNADDSRDGAFDIGALKLESGGTGTNALGDIQFVDDGPALGLSNNATKPNDLRVDNNLGDALDSTDDSLYVLGSGSDGQKSYTIVNPADGSHTADSTGTYRWTYDSTTGANAFTSITGTVRVGTTDQPLYTLVLNPNTGAYTFTMIGTVPGSTENLGTTLIHAGGPTNQVDVKAATGTDFGRIVADSTVGDGNVNASHGFVGVDNGNLDPNESLTLSLHEANGDLIEISGINIGTKAPKSVTYDYFVTLSDDTVVQVGDNVVVPGGSSITVLDPNPSDNLLIKSVTVEMVSGNAIKIGLGNIQFILPPTDVQLGFMVELKDGDNDFTTQSFVVDIDADNDGDWESNVSALSLPAGSQTLSAIQSLHHHELASLHDGFAV